MADHELIEHAWRFVLKSLRQGIWILDPEGNVVETNAILGKWLESSELVGTHSSRWLKHKDVSEQGGGEAEIVSASGIVRKIELVSEDLVAADGRSLGKVQILTDQIMSRALGGRLVEEVRRMAKLAGEDSLTGLANRRAFTEALGTMQAEMERKFGVVVVDLDDFKAVNDTFGHRIGDKVLTLFAQKLLQLVRGDDLVARIGGDEFAILLPNVNMVALTEAAERLRKELIVEIEVNDHPLRVYASVGYAHSGPDPTNVVERADMWMYQHKSIRESAGLVGLAAQEAQLPRRRASDV